MTPATARRAIRATDRSHTRFASELTTMGRRRRGRAVHGILLVDKPSGPSSNAVLQRVRRALDAAKAGHAGTLDPLATGMLPVLLGEATKFADHLITSHKAYEATVRLGIETDSLDADGEVTRKRPVPEDLDAAQIEAAAAALTGEIWQTPPMVSAIKINGKRLYKAAREGREIERPARQVTVDRFEILALDGPDVRVRVQCSTGTYIRVLAADLGDALGCGAHITALRRLWVSPFEGTAMHTPEVVEQDREGLLLPADAGLEHLSRVDLDAAALQTFRHGQAASATTQAASGLAVGSSPVRVYGPEGHIVGLGAVVDLTPLTIQPTKVLQLDAPPASVPGSS